MFDIWRESTFGFITETLKVKEVTTVICIILTIILLNIAYYKRKNDRKSPPCISGWIPWLGCSADFGKQPLEFIKSKSYQLGNVFTLYVAGETLTFLTDPEDFHYFFDNKDVDFQHAVQEPVQKLASINRQQFYKYHTKLHDMVKCWFAPVRLGQLLDVLNGQIYQQFDKHVKIGGKQDLMVITKKTLYASVLNTVFGVGNPLVTKEEDFEEFVQRFQVFDGDFELGLKLPSVFLPNWTAAKKYFLGRMKMTVTEMRGRSTHAPRLNILDELLRLLDDESLHHKYSLLLMFSSIANSVPAAYWALMYILTNEDVKDKVLTELNDVFGDKQVDEGIVEEDLKKLTYLRWCVYETIRLRGEGIIARKVIRDTNIKSYTIKAGSMLVISPFWSHRDERYFPEPEVFKPERWENSNLDRKGFVAFGGGRYQCPGRWFGMMSMQTFIALFLLKYTCTVQSPVPKPSLKHLVGVQHPETQFFVTCQQKKTH